MRATENLLPVDGEALYFANLFSEAEALRFLEQAQSEIQWSQSSIWLFGRKVLQPRLTAWYGDPESEYGYSGIRLSPLPWTQVLMEIKQRVELKSKEKFNSVLLNQYRSGSDSMGWHRDDEKELGFEPVIASVSFGATRKFQFRHRSQKSLKTSIDLESGSLLIMKGQSQHCWEHAIPKTKKQVGVRINLTFRKIR